MWSAADAGDATLPRARFELSNSGGAPVKILSYELSCGCMEARLSAEEVQPGGHMFVDVTARRFVEAKSIAITLETDSPLTPRVEFYLDMIPDLKPPFLLRADAALNFLGSFDPSDAREMRVLTVARDAEPELPRIEGTPPFLEVELVHQEDRPYDEVIPGAILREYRYRVRLRTPPPPGPTRTDIRVVDPWNPGHIARVLLFTNLNRPVRVSPELVLLQPRGASEGGGYASKILIASDSPLEGLRHDEGAISSKMPLCVTRLDKGDDPHRGLFEVRLDPADIVAAGADDGWREASLTFRWSGGEVDVPVVLSRE